VVSKNVVYPSQVADGPMQKGFHETQMPDVQAKVTKQLYWHK